MNWLRFILAIYLVLFHTLKDNYDAIRDTWLQASLGLGNLATSVFFVLSGFLLMHAYVVVKGGRAVDKRKFWVARFSTLYPLHIATLLLGIIPVAHAILVRGQIKVPTEVQGAAVRALGSGELVGGFFLNAALLSAWNPFYLLFNGPAWSLSALACYYLIFPFIALRIYEMKRPIAALVFLGIAFALPGAIADLLHLDDVVTAGILHRNPVMRLPLFIAGMVLCVAFARARNAGSPFQFFIAAATTVATLILATELQYLESEAHLIKNGLYYPASLAILWLCVCLKTNPGKGVQYWGARLGSASLPMFLLHVPLFPVFRAAEKFVKALIHSPDWSMSAIMATGKQIDQGLECYWVYLVVLTVICVLVQERFVVPIQGKIRNRMFASSAAPVEAPKASRAGPLH